MAWWVMRSTQGLFAFCKNAKGAHLMCAKRQPASAKPLQQSILTCWPFSYAPYMV